MPFSEVQKQDDMTCPVCGEVVAADSTWTEQYGTLTVRGCPSCECTSEIVKWIAAAKLEAGDAP